MRSFPGHRSGSVRPRILVKERVKGTCQELFASYLCNESRLSSLPRLRNTHNSQPMCKPLSFYEMEAESCQVWQQLPLVKK